MEEDVRSLLAQVRKRSFPELNDVRIHLQTKHSDYSYMDCRFTLSSLLFSPQLQYLIRFNPAAKAKQIPQEALRGVIAHELAHVLFYRSMGRIGALQLIQLLSPRFTARFERAADLVAIERGYGPGLAAFRTWLYENIPANRMEAKLRDYFSPQEIAAIVEAERRDPRMAAVFAASVPLNLSAVQQLTQQHGLR